MSDAWGFETRQIHVGGDPDPTTARGRCRSTRRPATSSATRRTPPTCSRLAEIGNIYTRIMNPTQGALEARLTALEGGCTTAVGIPGALVVASGQAAEMLAIPTSPRPAITSSPRRRCTAARTTCCTTRCPKLGIEITLRRRPRQPRRSGAPRSGPTRSCSSARRCQPQERHLRHRGRRQGRPRGRRAADHRQHGADAVSDPPDRVGRRHRRALGRPSSSAVTARRSAASIIDGGTFDFGQRPVPQLHRARSQLPRPAVLAGAGPGAFIIKARVQLPPRHRRRVSPFNSFLFLQGLETLSLRMERHFSNAARWPSSCRAATRSRVCICAGLPSQPVVRACQEVRPRQGLRHPHLVHHQGWRDAGQRFVEALELHSHVANIGDVRSLVIHPATTTHSQLTEEEQADRCRPGPRAPPSGSSRSTTSSPTSKLASAPRRDNGFGQATSQSRSHGTGRAAIRRCSSASAATRPVIKRSFSLSAA